MNYYYTFIKEDQYITVSGSDDLANVKDLKWASSPGAAGVLKQMDDIKSAYSPTIGFVSIDDYKNDIYVQIAKFGSIYKDGWRFDDTNIPAIKPESNMVKSEVLEKAKTKKRVYVKATKGRKAHYRMQEVGREEIDPKAINNLWEISLDQFKRLCTGDKILLKEHYIEHYMREYTVDNPHPQLEYLVSLMNDRMKDRHSPPIFEEFTEELSMHEKAVAQALDAHEYVPLRVLKDYPDLAKAYGFDISEGLLEAEARQMDFSVIHRFHEMPKSDYDDIMKGVKVDYNRDPKKITDKMLDYVYPEQLKDVKRAAKFRKKIFNALPKHMKYGFTPDTMNEQLHKEMVEFAKKYDLKIPDEVKAGYPTIFTDQPFSYKPTGNVECDTVVNDILTEIRGQCGDDLSILPNVINAVINPTDRRVPVKYDDTMSVIEKALAESAMDGVSKFIGPGLMSRIESKEPVKIVMEPDKNRSWQHEGELHLSKGVIDEQKSRYGANTISHEYGHAIDHILPEICELSHAFIVGRTGGDVLIPLKSIMPWGGYDEWEETKPDNFMSPYIGKIYVHDGREILSMGMGYLQTHDGIVDMYEKDPEYLGFILAIVSGKAKGIKPGSAHPWTKSEIIGDGGIMFEPIDVKLSPDQIKAVTTKLSDKGLLKKFEIPDEILEAAGIDPKKMNPDQLKAMFAELSKKGLLKPKPDDKKSTDKKPPEKQSEGASRAGRAGLVKKKVTVHRGGKTFQQERWVRAGEEGPVEKPKKVEEKPPEKPKGPVIMGLNKPEMGEPEPEPEKKPEKELEKVMIPDNLKSIESFSDLGIQGGMHKEETFITTFKDGSKAIHKTMDPGATFGEVSASEVNKILGWDVIPETVDEDFGKGRGSTQKWIEGSASPINRYHVKEHAIKLEEKHFDDLSKMFVLDMAVGNGDRTTGNIVIKDDKCYGIDNEIINKPMTDWQMEALDMKVAGEEYFGWCPLIDVFTSSELGQDDYIKFKKYVMNNMKNVIDHSDEILKYYEENKKSVKDGNIDNIKSNIDKMKKYYNK